MTPLAPSRSRTPFCTLMDCHLGPLRRRRCRRLTTCTGPPLQRGLSSLWRKSYILVDGFHLCQELSKMDGTRNLRCLILFQNMELSLHYSNAMHSNMLGKMAASPICTMDQGPHGPTRATHWNDRWFWGSVLCCTGTGPWNPHKVNGQQSILLTVSLKMFHCHKTISLFLSHEGWQDDNWW